MKAVIALAFALLAVIAYGGYRIDQNTERIGRIQKIGTQRGRETAYRLCERDNYVRALVMWKLPRERAFLEKHLPIVDCTPNLRGEGAELLQPLSKQHAYVRRFAQGKLPPLPVPRPPQ